MPARLFLCAAFCCALVSSAYAQRANRDRTRELLAPQLLGRGSEAKESDDDDHVPVVALTPSERQNRARAVEGLRREVRCDFLKAPLTEVVKRLSEDAGVPVELDEKSFADERIRLEIEITSQLRSCTLQQALEHITRNLPDESKVTWIFRGRGVCITTKVAVDSHPEYRDVVVYPVADLIGGPGTRRDEYDFDALVDLITSTIGRESWKDTGTGEGTINPFPDSASIVVSQTFPVHEQIANLLESLRTAKAQQAWRAAPREATNETSSSSSETPRRRATRQRTRWGVPPRYIYGAPVVG